MRRQKGRFDMFLQVCNAGPASFCQKQVYCFGKGMRAYTFVIHKGVDQCTSMDLQAKFKLVVSLRGKTCFSGMLFSYGNPCHTPKPPNWTRALNSVPLACVAGRMLAQGCATGIGPPTLMEHSFGRAGKNRANEDSPFFKLRRGCKCRLPP